MSIRLDVAVHDKTPSLSRAFAQKLIKDGKVIVNGEPATKAGQKVNPSDKITVEYQDIPIEKIDLPVIYEDKDCVVINKPAGILSHSKGAYNPEATVATWLEPKTSGFDITDNRTGIVHRLDRGTSGVMICAKNPETLEHLKKQFSSRKAKKVYVAVIEGEINPTEATIDLPIERNPKTPQRFRVNSKGKTASTYYRVFDTFKVNDKQFSTIYLEPKTGRTHQLRVHLSYLKKPIIGDEFYGGKKADRLYLHARELLITLVNGKLERFEAEVPKNFKRPKV